jgi:hypothetical protein
MWIIEQFGVSARPLQLKFIPVILINKHPISLGVAEEAVTHPEACIEVGFPLRDVKMKEAAN